MKKIFLWLAAFRLRILFRTAFLCLVLAVMALAVAVLQGEKQRSYENYRSGFAKTKAQIVARLRHPSGQLALLNPTQGNYRHPQDHSQKNHRPPGPVLLPFSAIDFDDPNKARHAVEMADCLVRYPRHGGLCVAIGSNPWIGGFIYAIGAFASGPLTPHEIGDKYLDGAHRMRVSVRLRGQHYRWIAPFEVLPPRREGAGVRGRFTGYAELAGRDYTGQKPVKEFRGWVWQAAECLPESEDKRASVGASFKPVLEERRGGELGRQGGLPLRLEGDVHQDDVRQSRGSILLPQGQKSENKGGAESDVVHQEDAVRQDDCEKKSFFSLRLPVEELIADLLKTKKAPWPPADLDSIDVHIELLPPALPGEMAGAPLFDSNAPGATRPFSLQDLGELLQAGETLNIRREDDEREILRLRGQGDIETPVSPLLLRLVRRLPVVVSNDATAAIVDLEDSVMTPIGNYRVFLHGEADSVVNQTLSATATRLSWFVGAVMAVIVLTWLVIEIGVVRRIAKLTRRARQLSRSAREADGLMQLDFSDLQGNDELGILAGGLDHLLHQVKEDAGRERIRVAQEKEQWHAVGHEIMSPLQSLLALHGDADDPDRRYLARMQKALRVLYGSASPSEAFQSSNLAVATLDLDAFLAHIAANAPHIGIENVRYVAKGAPVLVRADEYSLEDVIGHVLKNADRHRVSGTPITLALRTDAGSVTAQVHNEGPTIAPEWLEKIFEYGFSAPQAQNKETKETSRGQGLFVARTYMAKMGGDIHVVNEADGVSFYLTLRRAETETTDA